MGWFFNLLLLLSPAVGPEEELLVAEVVELVTMDVPVGTVVPCKIFLMV